MRSTQPFPTDRPIPAEAASCVGRPVMRPALAPADEKRLHKIYLHWDDLSPTVRDFIFLLVMRHENLTRLVECFQSLRRISQTVLFRTLLERTPNDRIPKNPTHWRRIIKRQLMLADPHCAFCGRGLRFSTATLDHLNPQANGGSHAPENLVLACYECNQSKRCRTPERWARDILRAAEKAAACCSVESEVAR